MSAVETVSIKIKIFGDFPEYYIVQTPFPAVPEHGVARGLPGAPQVLAGTEHRCGTPALCHTLRVGGGRPRLLPALAGSRCAGFS